MKNELIKINFRDILSELESKNLMLCFVSSDIHNWGLSVVDKQNNLYRIESSYDHSKLDNLIKDGSCVEFEQVDVSTSKNIEEWEKEIWDVLKVKRFIETTFKTEYPKIAVDVLNNYREELHKKEMINSYAFFMDKYFNDNKSFHFPTNIVEHDDTYYVLEHEGRKIEIEFDPGWSQLVYTVNGKGPFAHTSYEAMWDDIQAVLELEDKLSKEHNVSLDDKLMNASARSRLTDGAETHKEDIVKE